MAMLAAQVNADAAILLSTGGGEPFGQMVRGSIPKEGWAGYSLRFWADIIDRRVADDMLLASTKFLLVQGGRDASGAATIARKTVDLFTQARRSNLTYWELTGLDHGMVDASGGGHMGPILEQASSWVEAALRQ